MKRIAILSILILPFFLLGQKMHLGFRVAGIMSVPYPSYRDSNDTGKPGFGPSFGLVGTYEFSEHWGLRTDLSLSTRGGKYTRNIPLKDTLYTVILFGVPTVVPVKYMGDVKGSMNFQYLEMPLMLTYIRNKIRLNLGPYGAIRVGGRGDTGNAHGIAGFDPINYPPLVDTVIAYNNTDKIRKQDYGILGELSYDIRRNVRVDLRGIRSFRALHNPGFFASQGQNENPLYYTSMMMGLTYTFRKKDL